MRQRVVRTGRAGDVRTIGLPLISGGTKVVGVGQGVLYSQRLTLSPGTDDRDRAGGRVVDIGDGSGCAADGRLVGSRAINVAGRNRDDFTDLRLGQGECRTGCTTDVCAISLPLVGDRAQAICVGKGVLGCERLALGCSAGDRD